MFPSLPTPNSVFTAGLASEMSSSWSCVALVIQRLICHCKVCISLLCITQVVQNIFKSFSVNKIRRLIDLKSLVWLWHKSLYKSISWPVKICWTFSCFVFVKVCVCVLSSCKVCQVWHGCRVGKKLFDGPETVSNTAILHALDLNCVFGPR